MTRHRWLAAAIATAMILSGCVGGSPSASPSTNPSTSPSGSAAPSGAGFELGVLPAQFVGKSIPGQRVLLLVTVSGSPADGVVTVCAEVSGATGADIRIDPASLAPGTVGEIAVVPAAIVGEGELAVTVTASRAGVEHRLTRTIPVVEGTDGEGATARAHLARFTSWLATNRPELGISDGTVWQGTPGSWVLVVTHYLFLSPEWEVDLAWHVMMPPDDWIRIQLRHRWTETAPSVAFEIPSAAGTAPPRAIVPDEAVWR